MSAREYRINGREYQVETEPGESLLTMLRERLGLTGTKYGCGEGACGACTVMIDGLPARSCVMEAKEAAGKEILTIEGLGTPERLHALQEAFLRHEAFQCGFCTPGMIVTAAALLRRNPSPSDEEILEALNDNICRCGTYPRILAAVKDAAGRKEASQ